MDITLAVMGDGGTGKSCLTLQKFAKTFTTLYDPTISDQYKTTIELPKIGKIYLEVHDTAGQEEFRNFDQWIREADGFILVYDVTVFRTFEAVKEILKQISQIKTENSSFSSIPGMPFAPCVVFANKCDLIKNDSSFFPNPTIEEAQKIIENLLVNSVHQHGSSVSNINDNNQKQASTKVSLSTYQKTPSTLYGKETFPCFLSGSAKENRNVETAFMSACKQVLMQREYQFVEMQKKKRKKISTELFQCSTEMDVEVDDDFEYLDKYL